MTWCKTSSLRRPEHGIPRVGATFRTHASNLAPHRARDAANKRKREELSKDGQDLECSSPWARSQSTGRFAGIELSYALDRFIVQTAGDIEGVVFGVFSDSDGPAESAAWLRLRLDGSGHMPTRNA